MIKHELFFLKKKSQVFICSNLLRYSGIQRKTSYEVITTIHAKNLSLKKKKNLNCKNITVQQLLTSHLTSVRGYDKHCPTLWANTTIFKIMK